MLLSYLCLIVFINQAFEAWACLSKYSVAYMCENNSVQGPGVTLDVSTAATSGYSNCSCKVTANMTGFMADFNNFPNETDCGAQLDILFDDKSMQVKCGALHHGQSTTGSSAQVIYTRSQDKTSVDSDYCISFHSNHSKVEFTLTCSVDATTTIGSAPSSSTTTTGGHVQSTYEVSSSPTDITSNLTKIVQTSTTMPTAVTSTTVQTPSSSVTSVFSDITTTTALVTSTTSFVAGSTTTHLSTSSFSSNDSVTVPRSNDSHTELTTIQDNTTTISASSVSTSSNSTDDYNTRSTSLSFAQTTVNSSFTTNTDTTQTSVILNTTSQNSEVTTTSFTTQSTTLLDNVTSSTDRVNNTISDTTTISYNNTRTIQTSTQITNYTATTTAKDVNVTQTIVNTTTSVQTFNNTAGPNTTNTFSTTADPFLSNTTTTDLYNNSTMETNSTNPLNTTADPNLSNTTTIKYDNITMENNTTESANTTAYPNTGNSTTTDADNINNTTGTVNTTSDPLNTTDVYNGTTISNTTSDSNDTITANVTAKPGKTTQGFWEPPYMDYDVPQRSKNNIVVILVPIAGVLLLVFIAVVVYIMCKRSRDAKRKTMMPNDRNKANKNGNTAKNNNKPVLEKPQNPTDMFTTQSVGKYPAKYKTENEMNGTMKSNFMDETKEDKLLREQFNSTLNASIVSDTSKPKNYEPSEREKDLLNHLELSSIVIESDPNDSNRYFKKDDPGDWYRVIMKGKKPRDPNTKEKKEKQSRKKKSKSSESEDNSGERRHRRKKHRDYKQRSQSDVGLETSIKRRSRNRHSSSDSFDNTLNLDDTKLKATSSSQSRQPRIVESKPANKSSSVHNDRPVTKQPQQVFSAPVAEHKHEPVKARVIVSKPSSDIVPKENTAKGSVMQINSKTGNQQSDNQTQRKVSISSSSSESFSHTNPQRNTPLRSSQTRNNLFGSSGKKLNSTKENEGNTNAEVKRPDIVPPLNLTQTGNKASRLDDDFEELLLSEC